MPGNLVSYDGYRSEQDARHREKMLKQHGNTMKQYKIKSKNSFTQHHFSSEKKNGAGFTLIETLIYIAIVAMVIFSVVGYSLSLSGARNKNYVVQNVQANSRSMLSIISENIRASSAVLTPGVGASSNQLVLDMPGVVPTITFSVSGGRLLMVQVGSPDTYLTDTRVVVSSPLFTNTSTSGERDNISIQMMVAYNVVSGDVEHGFAQQLRTSVTRRN